MMSSGWTTPASLPRPLPTAISQVVARHKSMSFVEKAADRASIDYAAAVNGGLRLVPAGNALKALEEDYARMVEEGLLLEDAEPFEALMARYADIVERATARVTNPTREVRGA